VHIRIRNLGFFIGQRINREKDLGAAPVSSVFGTSEHGYPRRYMFADGIRQILTVKLPVGISKHGGMVIGPS